jgi:hypothetical protein
MPSFRSLALLLIALAPAARADGPAVSALNGKFSLESGSTSSQQHASAIGIAQGSVTAPLGHSFGMQLDGQTATAYGAFLAAAGLHVFWRDPEVGLFGPIASFGGGSGQQAARIGAEGELYAGPITVGARAGYQELGRYGQSTNSGFYGGRLALYPVPDLMLALRGGQSAGFSAGGIRIEYQPELFDRRALSLFVDGAAGDSSFYRVTAGLRIYFGAQKSLIRRHREDDPQSISASTCPQTQPQPNGGIHYCPE